VSTTLDNSNCSAASSDGPLSPFYALHYGFGMLLGVADFETEQAYHRGKMRLHNAWLHREGVAWGLGVGLDTKDEIRVTAGLATDAAGRELYLDKDACLNVPAWFDAHKADAEFTFKEDNAGIVFDGHVVIRFKQCLTRQVPSLSTPVRWLQQQYRLFSSVRDGGGVSSSWIVEATCQTVITGSVSCSDSINPWSMARARLLMATWRSWMRRESWIHSAVSPRSMKSISLPCKTRMSSSSSLT
jgi:hypothetical protein